MSLFVDIEKTLGSFHLRVKFEAGDETLALLGASGSGKSLTLKCIAGIETPDKGRIVVDGVTVFDSEKKINLPPQRRRTGLLFQNYALFPNMTVLENVQAGARWEKDTQARLRSVEAMLGRFGLAGFAKRYPAELSGGEQQRLALARILVSAPQVLLLDEPFSALDSHLRFRLERELREELRRFGKTVLLVSHDRDEVYRMADSIAVMDGGAIQALGEKKAVFADPKTIGGALLTGCKNVSPVEVIDEFHVRALDWGITLRLGTAAKGITAVGIRMHDVALGEGENSFCCRVVEEIENPFSYTLMLRASENGGLIGCELPREEWEKQRGETLQVSLPMKSILPLQEL